MSGQELRPVCPPPGTRVAVVVAHPDDEILWAGGLLLSHPEWSLFIVSLCRGQDPDRAPRFKRTLSCLGAGGRMGNLDDAPEQSPLPAGQVEEAILALLPGHACDLLLTHGPRGEYTRHRRHEEVSRAMRSLWREGHLQAASLWEFAYEDGGGAYLPRAQGNAPLTQLLPEPIWARKARILRETYGFAPDSWEARTCPRMEAFHCHPDPGALPLEPLPMMEPCS